MKLLVFLCITILSLASRAQTAFSFSGLSWGDTLPTVDAKLSDVGLRLRSHFPAGCLYWQIGACDQVTFTGSERVVVNFFDGKLTSVTVESGGNDYRDRLTRLAQKYGPPTPNPNPSAPPSKRKFDDLLAELEGIFVWRSPKGETIGIQSDGTVLYRSAPPPKTTKKVEF